MKKTFIILVYGKMLIGKDYGVRDLETKEPITKSTNMEMASVSSRFAAFVIMPLIKS